MKRLIIRIIVPLVTLGLCVWGDIALVKFLFSKLPPDVSWLFWAKLGIVVVDIGLFAGLIIGITTIAGIIANVVTE